MGAVLLISKQTAGWQWEGLDTLPSGPSALNIVFSPSPGEVWAADLGFPVILFLSRTHQELAPCSWGLFPPAVFASEPDPDVRAGLLGFPGCRRDTPW